MIVKQEYANGIFNLIYKIIQSLESVTYNSKLSTNISLIIDQILK